MSEPVWRWAPPPLPPDAGPAERLRRRRAEAALTNEMRWIWNELCSGTDLTRRVVPTGVHMRVVPRIGPISLGPPTRFSVELRPGQLREDLAAVRHRIAAAYEVDDAAVLDLVRGWVTVELIELGARERPAPWPDGAGVVDPAPEGHRRGGLARRTRRHFPPRGRRGPAGGPRLGR